MIQQSISSEAEGSREMLTPQCATESVLLIHDSGDSRESRNSCNEAGICGEIGMMSGRTEST